MITMRFRAIAPLLPIVVMLLPGCGGGGGGSGGGTTSTGGPLAIQGLPAGICNAASLTLRVNAGSSADSAIWTLDAGMGPVPAGSGAEIVLAPPEGRLVVAVRVVYNNGSVRTGSAELLIDRTPPLIRVSGIRVHGTTSGAAQVVVHGVADADGAIDASFLADFSCDGAGRESSLAVDAGTGAAYELPISVDGLSYGLLVADEPPR